ncbi:hypothetical protein QN379_10295 [Glaciimonas sp. Gout2]|nr:MULTISPECIES: hypothetical protein [unclassified Glaciimonas]MEB0012220.1 hypothetical protein [Glaciimonas sp. Cout2]MEB0082403.1 hypothetical protein [Glaciimonas sp. Gout2]
MKRFAPYADFFTGLWQTTFETLTAFTVDSAGLERHFLVVGHASWAMT